MVTQCLMRKVQFRGLCSEKKAQFILINELFFRKHNEENGLFGQTLLMTAKRKTTNDSNAISANFPTFSFHIQLKQIQDETAHLSHHTFYGVMT